MTVGISPLAPVAAASSLKVNPPRSKSPRSFAGGSYKLPYPNQKNCPRLARVFFCLVGCLDGESSAAGGPGHKPRAVPDRAKGVQGRDRRLYNNPDKKPDLITIGSIFGKRPHEPFGIELSPALKAFHVYERIFEIILVNGPHTRLDKSYLSHHKAFFCLIGSRL